MGRRVLKKFDQYLLLDCIAIGGMAEIFRARPMKSGGAGRLVIIKRIIREFSEKPEFRTMFKSEIKTMMGFSHPNIAQLHDYGKAKNTLFIVLEYIEGKSLRQVLRMLKKTEDTLPIPDSIHICEQAASGLHYAHTFKDRASGEPLHLVHRDVTPQNVLISFDGGIKVIDFGIAKARTNLEDTQSGIIKGKPNYVSPEQIAGKSLDPRSDIFSLGAVLWEALAGRKLFFVNGDDSGYETMKLIEECDRHVRPPSRYNSKVPKELDAIVLKMLAKDRKNRFQTAADVQRELHRVLYSKYPDFNPADLPLKLQKLFAEESEKDRKWLQYLTKVGERLIQHYHQKMAGQGPVAVEHQTHLTLKSMTSMSTPEPNKPTMGSDDPDRIVSRSQSMPISQPGRTVLLTTGMDAPTFQAMTFRGKVLDLLHLRGKKVWLAFYRDPACESSLHHLAMVQERARDMAQAGLEFVGVFDSAFDSRLLEADPHAKAFLSQFPFPLIADPEKRLYRLYGAQSGYTSFFKVLFSISLWGLWIQNVISSFFGWFSRKSQPRPGFFIQFPSHFLVQEDGKVNTVHYGRGIDDHISAWRVQKFMGPLNRAIQGTGPAQIPGPPAEIRALPGILTQSKDSGTESKDKKKAS